MFGEYEYDDKEIIGYYTSACLGVPYRKYHHFTVDQKYKVGGLAYSYNHLHGEYQKGNFTVRFYRGNDKGTRRDNKIEISNQPVFGFNPYYHYDWRGLGLGGGFVSGSLPREDDIVNFNLQLDLRLGYYDIFFVEFKYNDHFPGSYPSPRHKFNFGTGLGLKNGTALRFGVAKDAGTYFSAFILIKDKLVIEPFCSIMDNADPGRQFSLTLHYRFNQKGNNRK